MSQPYSGPYGVPQQAQGQQPNGPQYPGAPQQVASPPVGYSADGATPAAAPASKSRRAYPTQQYDFTASAAPVEAPQMYAGGPVAGAAYGAQDQQFFTPAGAASLQQAQAPVGYGQPAQAMGYPQDPNQQFQAAPIYGANAPVTPGYGPTNPPPAQQPQSPGMAGMTQQFGQMGVQGAMPTAGRVTNNIFPVDLMTQPPIPAELDAPPPTINLPPNTALTPSEHANCPPEYMRSTLNAVPQTSSLLKKSKLPFALTIRPYITLRDDDAPVPVIPDTVIARCRRCRTYINPFAVFIEGGNRWRCQMCNLTNDVPQSFDWDPVENKQLDRWQRAELNYSVVDFIAPKDYMVRPPQPLVYLFLIDVSMPAVQSGLVATTARTILESLDRIPNVDKRTRIGFMAVDSALHYFSIVPGQAEPNMLVISDLDEPFLPQPDDLLVNLHECREGVETLLSKMQDMFGGNTSTGNAMGPALRAAHKLASPIGGKVVCLMASLPNLGVGALKPREDPKLLGTAKETGLLQAQNSFYKSFAVECSKSQVSVDMFLFASGYQDVASLSCLPRFTGGQTFYYPSWSASRTEDAVKFAHELSEFVSAEIQLETVMRVRATSGLRMSAFYGNFFARSSDLLAFPAMPRDQGYCIEVAIDENMTKSTVCFQTAVLHSTCKGERRIRVLTLCLPVTQNLSEVYASADQVAIATLYANKAVERTLDSGLNDARETLFKTLVELLQVFKKELTTSNIGAATPLQFTHNLRLLPLLILALTKHTGLRKTTQIPTDMRSAALALLSSLPGAHLIPYIHPRFYSLHNMPDEAGLPGAEGIVMPPTMNLNSQFFEPHGLYLIGDGQQLFLWVGRAAVPQLIQDVFGLPDITGVRVGKATLPVLENQFSQRINAIIGKIRESKDGSLYYPHLYIVREDGEPALKAWALSMLAEDRTDGAAGYQQWLMQLKDKVNA
ncbi:hypothetical protein G7K_0843-t1 [Saitoella complicata NRRL Y-17804]|uniref:Protein transport protein SEC24 n=2 Tax=Saitoella complicata (strain BCRC 22490 / CBS 7301 / JCM 7358 / NBRC 10748 / NRRL Y-17804) TaxID=698492 RepID=A0A0E9NA91_SAICN|nr:hypothetical protein G7K_0843-t1 [Saitoella complicata NRRL Y-17804]